MYLYIYDNFLTEKKYQTQLYRIENRLVDLGIKGRVIRLNILKNMAEVVEDGIKQGVKTVVVIGNDLSFSKIINIIADKDVTLGIIPVDDKSKIAKILGIPPLAAACEILAQRIVKKIDLEWWEIIFLSTRLQLSTRKPP
jgi:diacylglycerol kinase family enzyme